MSVFVKAAVIGHPIAHSKSPLIHNYWIKKYGMKGSFEAIDISCENLAADVQRLIEEGYRGFSVTLPHKEAIMNLCAEVDDLARAVGAVNTVTIENGALKGSNTDVFGIIENIRTAQPGFNFTAGPAVVLGAGGAARAVVHGLLQEGAPEIRLINRSPHRADVLAHICVDPSRVKVFAWERRAEILNDINLLVNATSLGMDGGERLEIDLAQLNPAAVVCDAVYAPLRTPLLLQAAARKNPTVTGIGMLLHQARPAFRAWFGVMPEIDAELERLAGA